MLSLAFVSHFLRCQHTRLPYPDYSFNGQNVIVTGANTGLGFEAAKHFVRLSAEKVILAVRNADKGKEAKRRIEQETGKCGVVEVWQLDLSSYESVKRFTNKAKNLPRIDVLLENAGVASASWDTAEGSEMQITVNVYGTFLLALLMFPLMQRTGRRYNTMPRLTIVSSDQHHMIKVFKEAEMEDLMSTLDNEKLYNGDTRYSISKLMEIYYVREFCSKVDARSGGVIMNMLNPGLCWSELARDAPAMKRFQIILLRSLLARNTEVGSRTLVFATTGGPESHGHYSTDCTFNPRAVSRSVRSEEGKKAQRRVFDHINRKLESIQPGILGGILVS